MFIRDSKIILIIYSIDNLSSFKDINFWINHIKEKIRNDKHIKALVANKIKLIYMKIKW